jgi:hypothetical protein
VQIEGLARCPARRGWLAPAHPLAADQPVTRLGSHDVPAAAAHDHVAAAVARVEAVRAGAAVQQVAPGSATESIPAGARSVPVATPGRGEIVGISSRGVMTTIMPTGHSMRRCDGAERVHSGCDESGLRPGTTSMLTAITRSA